MNFKFYNFLIMNSLLAMTFLFSSSVSYTMAPLPMAPLQLKIINETNKDISIAEAGKIIATVKANNTTDVNTSIKFGAGSLMPYVSLFEISPKLLFIYLVGYKEGKNNKLIIALASKIIDDITDALDTEDPSIVNQTVLTFPVTLPKYEATLTIKDEYFKKKPTIEEERSKIMEIIKKLAPSLYQEIVAKDPTGAEHIIRNDEKGEYNTAIRPSTKDGFPEINIGSKLDPVQIPEKELEFIIAHELGHYALRHPEEYSTSPEELLQHAFLRNKESEADRFAIVELGIPIEYAEKFFESWIKRSQEPATLAEKAKTEEKRRKALAERWEKRKEALAEEREPQIEEEEFISPVAEIFMRTHPFSIDRIQQVKDLKRELEAKRTKPVQIDWEKLAKNYLKIIQEQAKK